MVSNELTRVQDTSCLRIGNLWAFWNESYYFILALWKDRNPKEFSCTKLCCSWTAVTACNNFILPPLTLSLFVWLPGSWGTGWTVNDVWFLVPHTRGVEPKGITSGRQFKRGRHEDKIPTTGENERDSGNGSTMVKVNHTPVHSSRDTHGRRRCAWGSPFFSPL